MRPPLVHDHYGKHSSYPFIHFEQFAGALEPKVLITTAPMRVWREQIPCLDFCARFAGRRVIAL